MIAFGVGLGFAQADAQHAPTEVQVMPQHRTSQTLTARQQAIPLIGAAMAGSDMRRLSLALDQGLDAGLTIGEAKEILVQLYAYAGFSDKRSHLDGARKPDCSPPCRSIQRRTRHGGLDDGRQSARLRHRPSGRANRRRGYDQQA